MFKSAHKTTAGWGRRRPTTPTEGGPVAQHLLRAVDLGLCAIIFVAPLFFGGRHDLGRLVFIAIVAATAAAWFVRQTLLPVARWQRTAAHGVLLAAAVLLVVQIVPLPASLVTTLAPRNAELLPLWTTDAEQPAALGSWRTLSLIPHETSKSLAMLVAYGLLFIVVVQRATSAADVRRLLNWIAVSAVVMAGFGLLQYFTSDGRFFWLFEQPFRSTQHKLSGSFANRNHFAHFLVLGAGPLIAWLISCFCTSDHQTKSHRNRQPMTTAQQLAVCVLAAAVVLVLFAVLRSLSRGGAIALLVSASVLVGIYAYRRLVDSRFVYGLIALTIGVVGLLSLYGYDDVARRLNNFTEGSIDAVDEYEGRRTIWAANLATIRDGWLTGAGAGSHREIYPAYLTESRLTEYTHAENGYLQIATENGVFGVVLLAAGVALCGGWCWTCFRSARSADLILCLGAAAAGLAASLVHSLFDFVWYIPACMSLTVILAACTLRLARLAQAEAGSDNSTLEHEHNDSLPLMRPRWAELAVGVVLVGGWAVHTFVGPAMAALHWDRYLHASIANSQAADSRLYGLVINRTATDDATEATLNDLMIQHLERVVAWDPRFARGRLRLAARYLARFELEQQNADNAMTLDQVRDAAWASSFPSEADLQAWLDRALGPNVAWLHRAHAEVRHALALCPLQGEGYVQLAQLSFLDGGDRTDDRALVDQALSTRPANGDVLFEVGRQALLAGNLTEALKHWTKCYADRGVHQWKIIYLLGGQVPAAAFVATFEPNWGTLPQVWARYREFGQPSDCDVLIAYAASAAERETVALPPDRAALVWGSLADMYGELNRTDEQLECLQRSYTSNPRYYSTRRSLARALTSAGRYAEAEPHVRWCLARRPEDKALSEMLLAISKHRLSEREQGDTGRSRLLRSWTQ